MTIPSLAYEPYASYKDIEIEAIYPNSEYYYNFAIHPSLPAGLSFDTGRGIIFGTPLVKTITTTYLISATSLTGVNSYANFVLSNTECVNGRSLVSLVVLTDFFPDHFSFKLYRGYGESKTLIQVCNTFDQTNKKYDIPLCLEHDIYTLELFDSAGDGWANPAGYYLSVANGDMIFEMGQVPSGVSSVSTMFSSYLPFQFGYSPWKYSHLYVANWNTLDFNDYEWPWENPTEIPLGPRMATYVRQEVNIPDITMYQVLNVAVKYLGGIVAYFNGKKVARFNLEEYFDEYSIASVKHKAAVLSKFHVIMNTVGGVNGKNVLACEIHRSSDMPTGDPIQFDAIGVFGVNECSPVLDTYEDIFGSSPLIGSYSDLMDLNPTTYGYQPNTKGAFIQWRVENLEGSRFNSLGVQTVYSCTNGYFSVSYLEGNSNYKRILQVIDENIKELGRNSWSVPEGIFGYRELRFELEAPLSDVMYVSSYMLMYCRPSMSSNCPGIEDFVSVGEREYSLGECSPYHKGNTYRFCFNGELGEINDDRCFWKPPVQMKYEIHKYDLIVGVQQKIEPPTYKNYIEEFFVNSSYPLPAGLEINRYTGEITGTPSETTNSMTTRIYGKNKAGIVWDEIRFSCETGSCAHDKEWDFAYVGETQVYPCRKKGFYFGELRRSCVLGETNGEWQEVTGKCIPYYAILLPCLIGVVLVYVVVYIVVKALQKKRKHSLKIQNTDTRSPNRSSFAGKGKSQISGPVVVTAATTTNNNDKGNKDRNINRSPLIIVPSIEPIHNQISETRQESATTVGNSISPAFSESAIDIVPVYTGYSNNNNYTAPSNNNDFGVEIVPLNTEPMPFN